MRTITEIGSEQTAAQLPMLYVFGISMAEYQLVAALSENLQTCLPSIEQIESELSGEHSRDEPYVAYFRAMNVSKDRTIFRNITPL